MSDQPSSADYQKFTSRPGMQHAIRTMPRWKWKLLGIALVVGCVGLVGQATTFMRTGKQVTIVDNKPVTQTIPPSSVPSSSTGAGTSGSAMPGGSSGFVTGQASKFNADTPAAPQPTATAPGPSPTLIESMTPFMSHVGFSLFVGVIVGLIFRTFLRMAALLTALIAVLIAAAAHFNVDVSAVKAQAAGAESWISSEGYKLKDLLFQALPSSTAAGLGFLMGFKRK